MRERPFPPKPSRVCRQVCESLGASVWRALGTGCPAEAKLVFGSLLRNRENDRSYGNGWTDPGEIDRLTDGRMGGWGRVGRWRSGRSNGMMKGGLTEKVTFEQRLCGDLGKCYKGKEEPVQRS